MRVGSGGAPAVALFRVAAANRPRAKNLARNRYTSPERLSPKPPALPASLAYPADRASTHPRPFEESRIGSAGPNTALAPAAGRI